MAKSLVAPANYTVVNQGVTFSVEFKLVQSLERDWAPYDKLQVMILDDCKMIVELFEASSVKVILGAVKTAIFRGLARSPHSAEILARRAQLALF